MKLCAFFGPEQILTHINVKDKWELFDVMLGAIEGSSGYSDVPAEVRGVFRSEIIKREREISTGVGDGVALPHARLPGLPQPFICLATIAGGIPYGSIDSKAVTLVCMLLTPQESPNLTIKIMSGFMSLFVEPSVRQFFLEETDSERIYEYIDNADIDTGTALTAGDLMRPLRVKVHPETAVRKVTRMMQKYQVDAASVVDAQERVVGEISCDQLFGRGIPEYLRELNSVPAAKDFDPFKKYFQEDANSTAGAVMSDDFAVVNEDATLLEVMFLLSIKKYPKVHVCRNGRIVGVIGRITVLHRVLNL